MVDLFDPFEDLDKTNVSANVSSEIVEAVPIETESVASAELKVESIAKEPIAADLEADQLPVINEYDQAVDRLLSQVINLSPDNILHEPTCVICNSPHREEIEQKWIDSDKDYPSVRQIMREKDGLRKISKSTIQNHMIYHVDRAIREIQKIEYVNRIKRLNSFNLSTLERIRLGMSAITERLMGVNSIVPDANTSASDIEKTKTMETARLMGSMTQLLKLQAEILGEMKSSGELVTIPRDDFIRVFNEAIIEATNDVQRDTIKDILNKLGTFNQASQ